MPQATEELRAAWPGGDEEAIQYLYMQGYKDHPEHRWHWQKPNPNHVPTTREVSAMQYLVDEWDYGGWVD